MGVKLRIAFATFGSLGDLFPYLAIGRELRLRGHDVVIATDAFHKPAKEAEGLSFFAVRPDMQRLLEENPDFMQKVMHAAKGSEYVVRDVFIRHIKESYEDFAVALRGVDLLVTHPLTFAAILAAESRALPWISTVLAPISFLSGTDPSAMPEVLWLPHLSKLGGFGTAVFRLIKQQMRRQVFSWCAPLNELRTEIGLPPTNEPPLFETQFSPLLTLALFSSAFAKPQSDWPTNSMTAGFPFFDPATQAVTDEQLTEFEQFLKAGDPPIVFTLGSSAIWDAGNFYTESIKAVRQLNMRAVLLCGEEERRIRAEVTPTQEIAVFKYLPHSLIFPRAAAVVHQGGIGTTAQALRAGHPQLVVPFSHDQPDNGLRIQRLGAGRLLKRNQFNSSRLCHELKLILQNDYKERSSTLGKTIQLETGAITAAEAIEKTALKLFNANFSASRENVAPNEERQFNSK